MPIKPENVHRYPANWPQIVAQVRARSGNRCEKCGVNNYALGGRLKDGTWCRALPLEERMLGWVWPRPGDLGPCNGSIEWLRIVRIVLTTAHLDHTPENCELDNLRHWCQRCHLSYDAVHHAQTAAATRREGRALGDLFGNPGVSHVQSG